MASTYSKLLTRYLGRRVCLSTHGQLKVIGDVASVHDDCVRLIDTNLTTDLDDQSWSHQMHDEGGHHRRPETVVPLHNIVALTCLEDSIQDEPLPDSILPPVPPPNAVPLVGSAERLNPQPVREDPEHALDIEPLEIVFGSGLLPLVDQSRGGDVFDRMTSLRTHVAQRLGFLLPTMRVRDNPALPPYDYVIQLNGSPIGRGTLYPDKELAIDTGHTSGVVEGSEVLEPAYGKPARWIRPEHRTQAEELGWLIVSASSVLATHLLELVQRHAHELFGFEQAQRLLDRLATTQATVVSEVVPQLVPVRTVHHVLYRLLEEGVPIRPLATILEALARQAPASTEVEALVAAARLGLRRTLVDKFKHPDGRLHALTLDAPLQHRLVEIFDGRRQSQSDLRLRDSCVARLIEEVRKAQARNEPVVVISPSGLRVALAKALHALWPQLPVLAYAEVPREVAVHVVAVVSTAAAEHPEATLTPAGVGQIIVSASHRPNLEAGDAGDAVRRIPR